MQYPPNQPQQPTPPGQYTQYPPPMQGQPYQQYPQQPPPSYQPYPPQGPYGPPLRKKNWFRRHPILTVVIAFFALACIVGALSDNTSGTAATASTTPAATSVPTQDQSSTPPTPTPQPVEVHYPPTTVDDLHGLAAKGDASAIHEFHSESVGLTSICPQPKREVIVDPNVTGQRLAEDLLAYFYAQQLDTPCGSLVLAYHNQQEVDGAYTAGRINFDVVDSSGAVNMDPNATNLKYTLTLDTGDVGTGQGYIVTY